MVQKNLINIKQIALSFGITLAALGLVANSLSGIASGLAMLQLAVFFFVIGAVFGGFFGLVWNWVGRKL
jgi:hypothetical protein